MRVNQLVFLASNTADSTKSLGERMGTALLNTVMGILIVFIVLIVISLLISCFKFINRWEMKRANKAVKEVVTETVPEPEVVEEEADLTDDLELVAVITAAIHAYEESQGNDVPANGLYVRSIRRVNKSRWQNA